MRASSQCCTQSPSDSTLAFARSRSRWAAASSGWSQGRDSSATSRSSAPFGDLIGPQVKLLIDANNGYTPNEARQVMREVGECDIFWFEEPFPESIEQSVSFKEFMREGGWNTLLADGETRSAGYDEEFEKMIRAGGIDVVQFDLRRYTLTRWLRYMSVIEETETLAAPHNWGSHLSGFYIPQFARGFGRFALGETDNMVMPGVHAEGYDLKEGLMSVPHTPGFGLELDEVYFARAQRAEGAWVAGAA